ncbi:hypothetical protein J6590_002354 [Homalodisca vitripennis]|nr:hypothetical protein J6590_002354 [Homalodisca vitripennis]
MFFSDSEGFEKMDNKRKTEYHMRFICGCGRHYKRKGTLAWHRKYECGQLPHQRCQYCEYKTHKRCNLLRHLRQFHQLDIPLERHRRPANPLDATA